MTGKQADAWVRYVRLIHRQRRTNKRKWLQRRKTGVGLGSNAW